MYEYSKLFFLHLYIVFPFSCLHFVVECNDMEYLECVL